MEIITLNAELLTANARREWRSGVEYLVAPATLLRYAVLPGSQGPVFYPREEVAPGASRWNKMPLTVGHPLQHGQHVSAKTPGVWEASGIGFVENVKANGALKGEGWFDVIRTRAYDRENGTDLYGRLERGEPLELSTGLFLNLQHTPGGVCPLTGVSYDHTARNLVPDHVAILPREQGACSVSMGCGVHPILNHHERDNVMRPLDEFSRLSAGLGLLANEARHFAECYGPPAGYNPLAFDPRDHMPLPPVSREAASPFLQQLAANEDRERAAIVARWASVGEAVPVPSWLPPRPLTANEAADVSFLEEARAAIRTPPPCDAPSQAVLNYHRRLDAEVAAARGDLYRAMDTEPTRI